MTDREFLAEPLKNAVYNVLQGNGSIRENARRYNLTKSRLCNFVIKAREVGVENVEFIPNFRNRQIFPNDMENALEKYLLHCSNIFHGLTTKSARILAFEYAQRNNCKIPQNWITNKMASEDWLLGYMDRHPILSLRRPEATTLARMSAFNQDTISNFFNKLEELFTRYAFVASDIYNLDEVCQHKV